MCRHYIQYSREVKKKESSCNIIPFIDELNRFKLEKKAWSELIIIEHNTIRSSSQLVNAPDFFTQSPLTLRSLWFLAVGVFPSH